ncbi:transposase, partial [Gallibacterium anatis]|uniref:transposase n=1 Tax=Gallibacterium anatis TaxID=750 RepID=UPI0012D2A7F4
MVTALPNFTSDEPLSPLKVCSGTLILQSSIGGKLSQKEDTKMRRTSSPDYKVAAVKLVTEQGYSVAQACSELGIGETALRRWI